MKGEIGLGLLYLFTGGLFIIGWILDIVSEYKKWTYSNQKQIVKILLFIFFIIFGISELKYSFIAFLAFIGAAILSLDFFWDLFNIKKLSLRIIVPLVLFIIGLELGSTVIPESSYGKWVTTSDNASYQVIEFTSDDTKIYTDVNTKEYISMYSEFYDSKIYLSEEDVKLVFSYDILKDEICLLDKNEECGIIYKRIETDK